MPPALTAANFSKTPAAPSRRGRPGRSAARFTTVAGSPDAFSEFVFRLQCCTLTRGRAVLKDSSPLFLATRGGEVPERPVSPRRAPLDDPHSSLIQSLIQSKTRTGPCLEHGEQVQRSAPDSLGSKKQTSSRLNREFQNTFLTSDRPGDNPHDVAFEELPVRETHLENQSPVKPWQRQFMRHSPRAFLRESGRHPCDAGGLSAAILTMAARLHGNLTYPAFSDDPLIRAGLHDPGKLLTA